MACIMVFYQSGVTGTFWRVRVIVQSALDLVQRPPLLLHHQRTKLAPSTEPAFLSSLSILLAPIDLALLTQHTMANK